MPRNEKLSEWKWKLVKTNSRLTLNCLWPPEYGHDTKRWEICEKYAQHSQMMCWGQGCVNSKTNETNISGPALEGAPWSLTTVWCSLYSQGWGSKSRKSWKSQNMNISYLFILMEGPTFNICLRASTRVNSELAGTSSIKVKRLIPFPGPGIRELSYRYFIFISVCISSHEIIINHCCCCLRIWFCLFGNIVSGRANSIRWHQHHSRFIFVLIGDAKTNKYPSELMTKWMETKRCVI